MDDEGVWLMDEVLFQAAQYMDEHGKCTQVYEEDDGRVCMVGAIRKVVFGNAQANRTQSFLDARKASRAEKRLLAYAKHKNLVTLSHSTIPDLNDWIIKTKEETVKFMMEAAEWRPEHTCLTW